MPTLDDLKSARNRRMSEMRKNDHASKDFEVRDEGTIWLLRPLTQKARNWIGEHLPADTTWLGDCVIVEHRYVTDILVGIMGDKLTLM